MRISKPTSSMAADNSRYNLSLMQRFGVSLLYGICRGVAIMPRWVRYYIIEEIIYFVMHHLMHYRRKVVMENLRNSFPERSEKELRKIASGFSRNLAEQMINLLSLTGLSSKRRRKLLTFPDAERYGAEIKGRNAIALIGHYGAWEFISILGLYESEHVAVGVYHSLESSVFDELFKRIRAGENIALVPRNDIMRYFIRNRDGKPMNIGLIADQNQYRVKDPHWITFLNQDTIFADGAEQLARRFCLPVYYLWLRRRRRGEYELHAELIYDGKEEVAEHEITERYARRLERSIRECPELWLWSHRRWKQKRE